MPALDVVAVLVRLAAVEARGLQLPVAEDQPAVTTPKVMWVESSQWWVIGASGLSMIDRRCMKAGGPNAGSPGRPA